MNKSWKKYLIITGIISIILGLVIPEIIEYVDLNYINPPKNFREGINIKVDGLVYALLYRTLIWSFIFYCCSILVGFLIFHFRKDNQLK